MDANFAKQAVVAAVPQAGKVKEMCPQCLLMQRLSSPCHCTAVQPGKAATLLRHGDLLNPFKILIYPKISSFIGRYSIPNNSLYYFTMTL
jgi:hypothetical protein